VMIALPHTHPVSYKWSFAAQKEQPSFILEFSTQDLVDAEQQLLRMANTPIPEDFTGRDGAILKEGVQETSDYDKWQTMQERIREVWPDKVYVKARLQQLSSANQCTGEMEQVPS
jgi:hypothetical protein